METDFKVTVGGFIGPLELLLDLIEKRKLHISEVTLSEVADDFIEHTKGFEDFPLADSADFILIASTLLLIKSRSLLPNLEVTEEEKQSIEELEYRLEQNRKFKEIAQEVRKMFGNFLYFGQEKKKIKVFFSPTAEVSIDNLKDAMSEVLNNLPKVEVLPKIVVQKVISLEEMINNLSDRVQKSINTSFRDLANISKVDKVTVIVSFLAMLELVKRGVVRATQNESFEDIRLESESLGVPSYN